jgi:hypothetical protein
MHWGKGTLCDVRVIALSAPPLRPATRFALSGHGTPQAGDGFKDDTSRQSEPRRPRDLLPHYWRCAYRSECTGVNRGVQSSPASA